MGPIVENYRYNVAMRLCNLMSWMITVMVKALMSISSSQLPHQTCKSFFFYDDVEVCNPLQSSRLKHKLGMSIWCMLLVHIIIVCFFCRIILLYSGECWAPVSFEDANDQFGGGM